MAKIMSASIQNYENVSDDVARIHFIVNGGKEIAEGELPTLYNKLMESLDNKARLVEGSVVLANDSYHSKIYCGFVRKTREFKSLEEASADDNFTPVSANAFRDNDDDLWEVVDVSGANTKMLQRMDNDPLDDLLSARLGRLTTTAYALPMGESYSENDCVFYFDVARDEYTLGLAVSKEQVYNPKSDSIQMVSPISVVAVSQEDLAPVPESAMPSDKNAIVSYYRTLYGHNKDFLKNVLDLINQTITAR